MKNKTISILLILNLITTIGMLNFFIKGQISKEKEIIKEMTESEQVSGLQTQINTLNESHEEYARNVQSYKRQIASAITDMGVATLETASVDTMTSNIRSISGASTAEEVSYDNTNSGLNSTNVQGAVDEVNNNLEENLSWKFAGRTENVNGIVTVPSDYKELLIFASPDSGIFYMQTSNVPFISGKNLYVNLCWMNNGVITYYADFVNNTVQLINSSGNNPYMNVYYR